MFTPHSSAVSTCRFSGLVLQLVPLHRKSTNDNYPPNPLHPNEDLSRHPNQHPIKQPTPPLLPLNMSWASQFCHCPINPPTHPPPSTPSRFPWTLSHICIIYIFPLPRIPMRTCHAPKPPTTTSYPPPPPHIMSRLTRLYTQTPSKYVPGKRALHPHPHPPALNMSPWSSQFTPSPSRPHPTSTTRLPPPLNMSRATRLYTLCSNAK
jgi:hypothetical protein